MPKIKSRRNPKIVKKKNIGLIIMRSHKFLEDVAIADVAFEAKGGNLNEVFEACGDATFETIADLKTIGDIETYNYAAESENIEDLLYEFLEEIVYLKDTESLIFKKCEVKISGDYNIKAKFIGEKIDREKQTLNTDVKAVTMHMFSLKKEKEGYKATIVLDI